MGSTLWLPGQPESDRLMVCRVLTAPGEICGRVFRHEGEWERHVGRCAREHIDVIRSQSLKERMPVFNPETWDPEVAAHMRKVGHRMKAEGRLEVRPNERAGFS